MYVPSISVIVPIYKVEKYIKQCIESLVLQTLQSIEIILVDDGSPDRSGAICDQYAEKHNNIKVIHQENKGVAEARNTGLAAATGKWISFVDGDDWLEPNMLERMLKNAEYHHCDICIGGHIIEGERKKKINRFKNLNGYTFRLKDKYTLFASCFSRVRNQPLGFDIGMPWAKLYRKRFIDKHNLKFPNLKRAQDYIFNLYAIQLAKKVILADLPLYHYRVFSDSIGNNYFPGYFDIAEQIVSEFAAFFNQYYSKIDCSISISYSTIIQLIRAARLQLVPKEAGLTFSQGVEKLRQIVKSEPYQSAIQVVDLKSISFEKRVLVLFLRLGLLYTFFLFLRLADWYKMRNL